MMMRNACSGLRSTPLLHVLLACLVLCSAAQTQAAEMCQKNVGLSGPPWVIKSSLDNIENGQVIGTRRISSSYYFSSAVNELSSHMFSAPAKALQFNAVPLPATPGVGLRLKWAGYWTAYPFTPTYQLPVGSVISRNQSFIRLVQGTYPRDITMTLQYDYELVIIDKEAYQGGRLDATGAGIFTAQTYSVTGSNNKPCQEGWLDALTPVDDLPTDLPRPALPTCGATNLGALTRLELAPVTASEVAYAGEPRSQGRIGERQFELLGLDCPPGTTMKVYFTDAQAPAAQTNYLSSSHPNVGVRLYAGNSTTPVQFGPAPVGATLPSDRAPLVAGPFATHGNLRIPVTAQYVQYPGSEGALSGAMEARATVTFMYD